MPGRSGSRAGGWGDLPLLIDAAAGSPATGVAAAAREMSAAVIHYDYDTLAEVMEFDSVWLAPAGTLP